MKNLIWILSLMFIALSSCKKEDKSSPFGSPYMFKITVPLNYNPSTVIDDFAGKINARPDSRMSSINFSKAANMLAAETTYGVQIFPILQEVSFDDCVVFLQSKKAILVGAQGLILSLYLRKNEFPVDLIVYSFDQYSYLWTDPDGFPNIPGAKIQSYPDISGYNVYFYFRPNYKENFLWPGDALICFTN